MKRSSHDPINDALDWLLRAMFWTGVTLLVLVFILRATLGWPK